MDKLGLLREKIEQSSTIALFGHEYIDGDCMGSMIGFGMMLEKMGKKVSYFTPIAPSSYFSFLNFKKMETDFSYKNYDCLFFLDFGAYSRIGGFTAGKEQYFQSSQLVVIDHHPFVDPIGTLRYVDVEASSNCELLYEICKELYPELIDEKVATAFYMGLTTDTGNFSFEKDSLRTMKNAYELLQYGVDKRKLLQNLFGNKSFLAVKFVQLLIERLKLQDGLLYTYCEETEMQEYGLEKDEAEAGVGLIQSIGEAKVFLFMRRFGDVIKCSLRSKGGIDVNAIAQNFGGGGHKAASGFKVPVQGDFLKQIEEIVSGVKKFL
ncbi:MAG TPA: bifunctional oligoribonuclease/PAP phosphatase NrnA [Candidatus Absconditabacterales bacterium]|nr:bifunctional oligoribonuclease/PAP phosphatase NrnA [Candidatus Absconditabacterales bacterium]